MVEVSHGTQPPSTSVMSKTLSNGTLSLRFMQNAQRAKNNSEVKPDKAALVDDAEWHVPQNARDAWKKDPKIKVTGCWSGYTILCGFGGSFGSSSSSSDHMYEHIVNERISRMGAYRQHVRDGGSLPPTKTEGGNK